MNVVGIDISKGKSMMAALRPMGEVALLPKEYPHTSVGLERMAYSIMSLGENTRVVMEAQVAIMNLLQQHYMNMGFLFVF